MARRRFYKAKRTKSVSSRDLEAALEHIRKRVRNNLAIDGLLKDPDEHRELSFEDEASVKERVALAEALYEAGRVSLAQYLIFVAMPIEQFHNHHVMKGKYSARLAKRADLRKTSIGLLEKDRLSIKL